MVMLRRNLFSMFSPPMRKAIKIVLLMQFEEIGIRYGLRRIKFLRQSMMSMFPLLALRTRCFWCLMAIIDYLLGEQSTTHFPWSQSIIRAFGQRFLLGSKTHKSNQRRQCTPSTNMLIFQCHNPKMFSLIPFQYFGLFLFVFLPCIVH